MTQTARIAQLNAHTSGLDQATVGKCRERIIAAYEQTSIVDSLARVVDAPNPLPSDFPLISFSGRDSLTSFNSPTTDWQLACGQLGRYVAYGEERHLFDVLSDAALMTDRRVNVAKADFGPIIAAVQELRDSGFQPDLLLVPGDLLFPFTYSMRKSMEWKTGPSGEVVLPTGEKLKFLWSSGVAPLDHFVVCDSNSVMWEVSRDPDTGSRLRVGLGEAEWSPGSVFFVVQTAARVLVTDKPGLRGIGVEGKRLSDEEYLRIFQGED